MANGVKNKSLDPKSESVSIFKFTTASEIMNHCLKLIYKLFHQGTKILKGLTEQDKEHQTC